jgi:integrase
LGFIQRRGPGRYKARYRGPDGRERGKTFQRKADAVRFLSAIETDKARGQWFDPKLSRISLAEWADGWLATAVHLKPKTRAGYQSLLRSHVLPGFGQVPLGRIEPIHVRQWVAALNEQGLSPSRTRQAYQLLYAMLKAAVESGYLPRTPCTGVSLPRVLRREMLFLSASKVATLAEAVTPPHDVLVYTLAYGGLRWGEGAALRRSRCHLIRSRLEVGESLAEVGGSLFFGPTKTYQRRAVVIPGFLREMLAVHLARNVARDPDSLVFTNAEGGPLRNSNFRSRVWRPALAAAGLPEDLRIHDLRHTCAALLIAQGAHPKAIQAQLGHSSIQVTLDRYGHLFPDDMDRLATQLDAAHEAVSRRPAASVRPGAEAEVIELPRRGRKTVTDQDVSEWGGEDSNLRPADYESAALTH